jgi:long-chain fatty acid transport protein
VLVRKLLNVVRVLSLLLSACVCSVTDLNASNPTNGAKAASMATAFVAIADDPSAILHNPAGLPFLRGSHIYGGITALSGSTEYKSPQGASEKSKPHIFVAPNLFITSDFGIKDMAFGLGIYSPFGIGGRTYSDWGLTRYISTESFIGTVAINPTFAWKPIPAFSFGVGLDYMYAQGKSKRMVNQQTLGAQDGGFAFEGNGGAWGFNVGLLYTLTEKINVGLTYRSRVDIKQCGTIKLEGIVPPLRPLFGGAAYETDAETTLHFPDNISFGIAFRPSERWTIGLDVEWYDWSRFSKSRIDIENEVPAAGFTDASADLGWKYQWYFKLGIEYKVQNGLFLRGGYLYGISPVPNRTLSPDNPDSNQHNLALGIGYKTEKFTIDGFGTFGYFTPRKVNNSILSGEYKNFNQTFGINLGYKF